MELSRRAPAFGALLRDWRRRRRLSQLGLGLAAEVSSRHISFLETGRARPSRPMVLRLADALDTPLGDRNALLEAAGFSAAYSAAPLDHRSLAQVRRALTRMMEAHAPYPAILIDRLWRPLDANPAGRALIGEPLGEASLAARLVDDPALRGRLANWPEVAGALHARLSAQARHEGGDGALEALAAQLANDPEFDPSAAADGTAWARAPFAVARVRSPGGTLAFLTATAEIGTPRDVTVAALRVELFFPADAATENVYAAGPEQTGTPPRDTP